MTVAERATYQEQPFQDFHDLLKDFASYEAIGTDDMLAAVSPLMRQVTELHEFGRVAPLNGVEALRADRGKLWFENARALEPKRMTFEVSRLQGATSVLDQSPPDLTLDGDEAERSVWIPPRDHTPTAPVYLLDYRCWEHAVGHHDPLTDIYSLGMIAASLATGLDFTEEDQLKTFIAHRERLTQLNKRLHPVVAELLRRMTELDRRHRSQDLPNLIKGFETHRQAQRASPVVAQTAEENRGRGRTSRILNELRARLYDLSRRNKLVFHKPSNVELNLTEASTPIVLHPNAIQPEQLFTWTGDVPKRVLTREPIPLAEFIRFEETLYAATALDKIRSQSRKDRTEFGYSPLRLVICWLRWRNLKEAPDDPIVSPLLLLPAEVKKRRGVRDSFDLVAGAAEAEVNPTLRRYLKLLYDVDLPPTLDLEQPNAVDDLFTRIAEQIAETEPGVRLQKVDRPPIAQIYQRARRRVDIYKKRARSSGPGLRKFIDIGYSYATSNYRPLGEQLFKRFVEPAAAPGSVEDARQLALPVAASPSREAALAKSAAAEKAAAEDGEGGDAYLWSFDLCSVTLGNFNYRKMSLVRDFDALLEEAANVDAERKPISGAFEALIQDGPKPIAATPAPVPLAERYPVMPSDPTQDAAVARARAGESYVIQGPPGTGKSQTIANLIADYLGRGKRVLFVCEKRAALDVVYHRLESLGLHRLCALVHDSQDDKRGFIHDVKGLYEGWLGAKPDQEAEASLRDAARAIERSLASLADLDAGMISDAEGAPLHELVARAAIDRDAVEAAKVRLGEVPLASLPSLNDWREGRDAALAMETALRRMGSEPVLARHPARFVAAHAAADPDLFARLTSALNALEPQLERLTAAAELIAGRKEKGGKQRSGSGADASSGSAPPLAALFAQISFAERLIPVADARKLAIMNPDSLLAETFRNDYRWHAEALKSLDRAQEKTTIWREKLSEVETEAALAVALRHEGRTLGFFSREWRRVKAEVFRRAGLDQLSIKPRIVDILSDLAAEHEAAREVDRAHRALAAAVGLADGDAAISLVSERDAGVPKEGRYAAALLDLVATHGDDAADQLRGLARHAEAARAAQATISECFESVDTLPVDQAFAALSEMLAVKEALPAFAPALRALSAAPDSVRSAMRRIDLDVAGFDAAIAEAAVERALSLRPALREAQGSAHDDAHKKLTKAYAEMRTAAAAALVDRARARFVEHITVTAKLDLELEDDAARARKEALARARHDLDREFGKSTRFRSVRELMAGDAGLLIRDLKPIWLMSPLSVADVLPLQPDLFDVAIFDEASQVQMEDAAPTLFRAPQVIVVGDEKQLPPTNFFGGGETEDDADVDEEDIGATLALDADSFLSQAARTLPSTLLGWHYRSRAEELIAFSNVVFYGGKLISIPSVNRPAASEPIVASGASDGAIQWKEVLARPVSFHHTPYGVYEKRRNKGEAEYIAEMVRGLLKKKTDKSIGVVAFSEAQQTEIERALERLARDDAKFGALYEAELEREADGQFAGLFVKNLENVQGDERDVIIVSVCYAPDERGVMRMNFGPINRAGGEKRLNVIFSRAKERIALVSTIKPDAIRNDYNTGALCLKTYLRYAEAASCGDRDGMRRALATVAPHAVAEQSALENALARKIAAALRERGYEAETAVGESAFVCDVAVRKPGAETHQLAILIDTATHYASGDLLERHVVKPSVLAAFGWKTLTVLSLDWRRDPDRVLNRIERAIKQTRRRAGEAETERAAERNVERTADGELTGFRIRRRPRKRRRLISFCSRLRYTFLGA